MSYIEIDQLPTEIHEDEEGRFIPHFRWQIWCPVCGTEILILNYDGVMEKVKLDHQKCLKKWNKQMGEVKRG